MSRRLDHTILLFITAILLAACTNASAGVLTPTIYAGGKIELKVLDIDSQQPLQGVLAFVSWDNEGTNPITQKPCFENCGPTCVQLVNVVTATSDSAGKIDIPAWTGKWGHCTYMPAEQPTITLYKPGYAFRKLVNNEGPTAILSPPMMSFSTWNGATVTLTPLGPHQLSTTPDPDNYVWNLRGFSAELDVLKQYPEAERCFWDEARPAILLLMQEERRLALYSNHPISLFEADLARPPDPKYDWTCGDQRAYLASLKAEAEAIQPETPPVAHAADPVTVTQVGGSYEIKQGSTGSYEWEAKGPAKPKAPVQALASVPGEGEVQSGAAEAGPLPKNACERLLPAALWVELARDYREWKIAPEGYPNVADEDADSADRVCHEVLPGGFIEQHKTSYAIILIGKEGRGNEVVIASLDGEKWNTQRLEFADCYYSSFCSIELAPAGAYAGVQYTVNASQSGYDTTKKRVTIDHDGVLLRSKRDEKTLFYYEDGKWKILEGVGL